MIKALRVTPDFFLLTVIIAVCSLIQSVFGVGLLVFGTPALMLLGHPFQTVLVTLLPCSILISLLQVLNGREELRDLSRKLALYCVPFIIVGLACVVIVGQEYNARFYVGCLLLVSGAIRLSQTARIRIALLLRKRTRSYLMAMGLVHGLTNMGGGLLTVLAASLFERKEAIRNNIASGYLIMALVQIIVLVLFGKTNWNPTMLVLPAVSAAVFLLFGNRLFKASTPKMYHHAMTILIFLFGIALVAF